MGKNPVVTKRYKDEKAFNKDAARMNKQGYEVFDVNIDDKGRGCARWGCLGIFAVLTGKRKDHVVTYRLMPTAAK